MDDSVNEVPVTYIWRNVVDVAGAAVSSYDGAVSDEYQHDKVKPMVCSGGLVDVSRDAGVRLEKTSSGESWSISLGLLPAAEKNRAMVW